MIEENTIDDHSNYEIPPNLLKRIKGSQQRKSTQSPTIKNCHKNLAVNIYPTITSDVNSKEHNIVHNTSKDTINTSNNNSEIFATDPSRNRTKIHDLVKKFNIQANPDGFNHLRRISQINMHTSVDKITECLEKESSFICQTSNEKITEDSKNEITIQASTEKASETYKDTNKKSGVTSKEKIIHYIPEDILEQIASQLKEVEIILIKGSDIPKNAIDKIIWSSKYKCLTLLRSWENDPDKYINLNEIYNNHVRNFLYANIDKEILEYYQDAILSKNDISQNMQNLAQVKTHLLNKIKFANDFNPKPRKFRLSGSYQIEVKEPNSLPKATKNYAKNLEDKNFAPNQHYLEYKKNTKLPISENIMKLNGSIQKILDNIGNKKVYKKSSMAITEHKELIKTEKNLPLKQYCRQFKKSNKQKIDYTSQNNNYHDSNQNLEHSLEVVKQTLVKSSKPQIHPSSPERKFNPKLSEISLEPINHFKTNLPLDQSNIDLFNSIDEKGHKNNFAKNVRFKNNAKNNMSHRFSQDLTILTKNKQSMSDLKCKTTDSSFENLGYNDLNNSNIRTLKSQEINFNDSSNKVMRPELLRKNHLVSNRDPLHKYVNSWIQKNEKEVNTSISNKPWRSVDRTIVQNNLKKKQLLVKNNSNQNQIIKYDNKWELEKRNKNTRNFTKNIKSSSLAQLVGDHITHTEQINDHIDLFNIKVN